MTRPALLTLCVLLTAPLTARAQSSIGTPEGYAFGLVLTASPAILFDIFMIKNVMEDGVVRKGFAINGIIFGGIATLLGGLAGYTLVTDVRVKQPWGALFIGMGTIGLGTVVLGVWG